MPKKSKKKSVETHFAVRCLQRLGYIPKETDLVKDIQEGKMQFYDRQSNRVTRWVWIDPLNGVECLLPYDKERKQLITILFKDIDYKKV